MSARGTIYYEEGNEDRMNQLQGTYPNMGTSDILNAGLKVLHSMHKQGYVLDANHDLIKAQK